jgi:hypothetical protein
VSVLVDVLRIAARLRSGNVILPIVAQAAAELPETAAKIVQPMMLRAASRPGRSS